MSSVLLAFACLLPVAGVAATTAVAAPQVPVTKQAADLVMLKNGVTLRGAVLEQTAGGKLGVAVARDWLHRNAANYYREITQDQAGRERAALEQLRGRIREWLKGRQEPRTLVGFLEVERARVERRLQAGESGKEGERGETSQLLLIEIPASDVRRHYLQPPAQRRLLLFAWQQRLSDPEGRSAADVARELESQGLDAASEQPNLSDRFPIQPENDRAWAARVALVEYAHLRKPHFQGVGDLLLRADNEADRPGVAELFTGLLKRQLDDLLDPAGAGGPGARAATASLQPATSTAEKEGYRGVRVTQLAGELGGPQVSVQGQFLARMPDGSWQPTWQHTETASTAEPRPELEERIASDPQVTQAVNLLKALGVHADGAALQTAVRTGAATMHAMNVVNQKFEELLALSTGQLDRPLLALDAIPSILKQTTPPPKARRNPPARSPKRSR